MCGFLVSFKVGLPKMALTCLPFGFPLKAPNKGTLKRKHTHMDHSLRRFYRRAKAEVVFNGTLLRFLLWSHKTLGVTQTPAAWSSLSLSMFVSG